eukprot:3752142-Rhodomonas_salina.1
MPKGRSDWGICRSSSSPYPCRTAVARTAIRTPSVVVVVVLVSHTTGWYRHTPSTSTGSS